MKKNIFYFTITYISILCSTVSCTNDLDSHKTDDSKESILTSTTSKQTNVFEYLNNKMDQFHKVFYVYSDADSAGNHFVARGRMASEGDEATVPPMNEHYKNNCYKGDTCIQASFISKGNNWGGWYFMNGVMSGDQVEPSLNWGDCSDAGVEIKNAKQLSFWARGEKGGEQVEFIAFGLGRDPDTGDRNKAYPDSSKKITHRVLLTNQWQQYSLDLNNADLSYVIGGFGWAANSRDNKGDNIVFYIDDIQYDYSRLDQPRFITSFETALTGNDVDKVMRNVAFTYDNAVALIVYLSNGDTKRAKLIADAFVIAQSNDRTFGDKRLRNAYKASEIELFSGWQPHGKNISTPMPGFTCKKNNSDQDTWCEDEFQVSTHTGNVAWAMLALLAYYEVAGGEEYLNAVKQLGEWVVNNCTDEKTPKGYTGGFEGWESNAKNSKGQNKLTYKATEHNIDLYSAFNRLYRITKEEKWHQRAEIAKGFVLAMWDDKEGNFWTGTDKDGITISTQVIPVDIQAWSVQALGNEGKNYWRAVDYAEKHHAIAGGFDFNDDKDGIWYEGTAQMAVAYVVTGQLDKWNNIMKVLDAAQRPSGAMLAASKDGLTTGFGIKVNNKWVQWVYYSREHLGATAWYALAKLKVNPFQAMPNGK